MSAGRRAVWFNRKNPLVTFIDIRAEVNPDIVLDSRSMPEEWADRFSLIVFDPPHCNMGPNSIMSGTYGHHTAAEIRDIISRSGAEAFRTGKENALMAFKWNSHDIPLANALKLLHTYWLPLFGHQVSGRKKRDSETFWCLLLKRKAPFPDTGIGLS